MTLLAALLINTKMETVLMRGGLLAFSGDDSFSIRAIPHKERTAKMSGKRYNIINIIGGGTKERLLSTLTASATGKYVVAGPDEATALGNIAVQAYAAGELSSERDIREAVKRSSAIEEFAPDLSVKEMWDEGYERFLSLCSM